MIFISNTRHSRIKPSAAITQEVKSTAHTSVSGSINPRQGPVYELFSKQRQDESRCVMQRVETPAHPLRAGPPLGCFTSNGGEGSGMACHHDYHSTTQTGMPALRAMPRAMPRAMSRVEAAMFNGRMDEQADQQRVLSAICLPPELQELLVKSAISRVPQGEENRGFTPVIFLSRKRPGG